MEAYEQIHAKELELKELVCLEINIKLHVMDDNGHGLIVLCRYLSKMYLKYLLTASQM